MVFKKASECVYLKWLAAVGCFNAISAYFVDRPIIQPELFEVYSTIQLVCTAITIMCFFAAKNYTTFSKYVILFSFYTYAVVCQFFIPFSFLTFIIASFFFLYFAEINQRFFQYTIITYAGLMIAAIYFFPFNIKTSDTVMLDSIKFASIHTVLITTVIGVIASRIKSKNKANMEFMDNKLYNLGSQTGAVIHDLKGLLLPPINYLNLLKKSTTDSKQLMIIDEAASNLEDIRKYVLSINQIFSFKQEVEVIKISDIVETLRNIYTNKTHFVNFQVKDFEIKTDSNIMKSIMMNLLSNSLEAFSSGTQKDRIIEIYRHKNSIIFKDNAGGFPKDVLKGFENGEHRSLKEKGSGIGLYLIKQYVSQLKGSISLSNEKNMAVVTIKLPKEIFHD